MTADSARATILDRIEVEAERLGRAAVAGRIPLRLMGGVAVWLTSPSVRTPPFARPYADMDFAGDRRAAARIKDFFDAHGYVAEKLFNALHGAQRLNFGAPDGRWTIDVVLDELAMSHRLDLRGRTNGDGPTLDLADLLLSKLQIWEVNRKDIADALCLLADHPLAEHDAGAIDVARIREVLGADWGFCHTVERNLRRVTELWRAEPAAGVPYAADGQVDALLAAIETAPKTLAWKARARVGERVRWYETPEEVRH